jgi:hypothetical protein
LKLVRWCCGIFVWRRTMYTYGKAVNPNKTVMECEWNFLRCRKRLAIYIPLFVCFEKFYMCRLRIFETSFFGSRSHSPVKCKRVSYLTISIYYAFCRILCGLIPCNVFKYQVPGMCCIT